MKIINKTKQEVISTKIILRENIFEVSFGLIPYKIINSYIYDYLKWKKFQKDQVMLFKVRGNSGIHTWFMSFPISIFFLDKNMKVIEKIELNPFETYKPKKNYEYFFEMHKHMINKINVGDKLDLR